MPQIYSELKNDADLADITIEDMEENQDFVDSVNDLLDEGRITVEVDADGEPRFYPVAA